MVSNALFALALLCTSIASGGIEVPLNPDDGLKQPPSSSEQPYLLSFDVVEPADGAVYTQKYKLKIMTRITFPGAHSMSVLESKIDANPDPSMGLNLQKINF